jgi:hypothetical protein
MVAINVASLPFSVISVITAPFSRLLTTVNPVGAVQLSGVIASATAWAVSASSYSSVIFACNFFSFELFSDEFVGGFHELIHFVQGDLSSCGDVVSSTFAAELFASDAHDCAQVDAFVDAKVSGS